MHLAKGILKQAYVPEAKWESMEDETVDSKVVRKHPGPVIKGEEVSVKEKIWQDVCSGVFARTLVQAEGW